MNGAATRRARRRATSTGASTTYVVDGAVNGVADGDLRASAAASRSLQTGAINAYLYVVVLGVLGGVFCAGRRGCVVATLTETRSMDHVAHLDDLPARCSARRWCSACRRAAHDADPLDGASRSRCRRSVYGGLALRGASTAATRASSSSTACRGSPSYNIEYFVGVDGISITMVLLTALLSFALHARVVRASRRRVKGYFALFLLLETGMMGVVRRARLLPLLRLLGGHAAADVLPDRHLGRPAARVRGDQVLPLHAARLACCCWSRCSYLYFTPRPAHLRHDRSSAALVAGKIPLAVAGRSCGWRSSSASPSRSRPSRSTPGCPTRTSRRRRRSR